MSETPAAYGAANQLADMATLEEAQAAWHVVNHRVVGKAVDHAMLILSQFIEQSEKQSTELAAALESVLKHLATITDPGTEMRQIYLDAGYPLEDSLPRSPTWQAIADALHVALTCANNARALLANTVAERTEEQYAMRPQSLPDIATFGQCYGPAMEITTQADADAYVAMLVERNMRLTGNSREEADHIERSNIGYYTGYCDHKVAERAFILFKTQHPIFGTTSPTAKEAFTKGLELGQLMKYRADKRQGV